MADKLRIGIVGGAGYTGGELLRFLSSHPLASIEAVTSETLAGRAVADHYRNYDLPGTLAFTRYDPREISDKCDFVFLAKPEPDSFTQVRDLAGKTRLVDLSANFRYADAGDFERAYGVAHRAPEFLGRAVYGLPEIFAPEIAAAPLVANPGCYPTAILLAILPAARAGLLEGSICASAVSGFSGAGRTPSEANMAWALVDNLRPYRVGAHPHSGELEEVMNRRLEGGNYRFTFVPQVAGFERGISAVVFAPTRRDVGEEEAAEVYREFYRETDFVRFLGPGRQPEIRMVAGTNYCDIGLVAASPGMLVLTSALDNLVKGASGQAIQNLNLMAGLPGRTGLR